MPKKEKVCITCIVCQCINSLEYYDMNLFQSLLGFAGIIQLESDDGDESCVSSDDTESEELEEL